MGNIYYNNEGVQYDSLVLKYDGDSVFSISPSASPSVSPSLEPLPHYRRRRYIQLISVSGDRRRDWDIKRFE